MAKKIRRYEEPDYDPYDEFEDLDDKELDFKDLARDVYSTDWDPYFADGNMTARRKIERRRDFKRVYSQLDDWEEFVD